MSESPDATALAYDLTDRLNKALRIGSCKPGEMAQVLGVSSSTMTNYLSGKTRPKDGLLRQWALRCGQPVTFDWLAYGVVETGPDGTRDQETAWCRCSVLPFPQHERRAA